MAPAATTTAKAETVRINPPGVHRSTYYTQVIAADPGRTLYVSGQWAYDIDGNVQHVGDLTGQAVLSCRNLKAVLAGAGATPEDVVKINVYIVDYAQDDLAALDAGLTACFGARRDFASTVVGVAALALDGMLFEIEAVAVTRPAAPSDGG